METAPSACVGGDGRPRGRQKRFSLTERDLAIAAFIDRVGCATPDQVGERFVLSERVTLRRLQALRQRGLLRSYRPLSGPAIAFPAGVSAPRVRDLDHSLEATSVAVQLELEGRDVVTERMMRREEYAAGDRTLWSIVLPRRSATGRTVTHRPDMAVRSGATLVALEVELTRKANSRLADLMSAWARQARYGEVQYLCRSKRLLDLVTDQALKSGADLVVRPCSLTNWHDRERSARARAAAT